MKLVLATSNKNKIQEIRKIMPNIEFIPQHEFLPLPEIIEDGETFTDNACKKARIIASYTNLPALADDSGLEVEALGGRPGVYSARYGGEGKNDSRRNELLLMEMEGEDNRKARFVCVIAVAFPDGTCHTAEGHCEGEITEKPSGEGGFGYDPVFFLPEKDRTMARLSSDEKNAVSHRGMALRKAARMIEKLNITG